jgi:L-aspartate oxidase
LLSEALRGHGALLRDVKGERFVDELLPRDVISRAMTARMLEQDVDHCWLDATALDRFDDRFPTIAASVRAIGLDPSREWLPIAPAAHYLSGGIVTDLDGATALRGLWASGEVACTGVHGANRLASNSLLEGMVFAPRVIEAIAGGKDAPEPTGAMRSVLADDSARVPVPPGAQSARETKVAKSVSERRELLQRAMTDGAGVLRSAESLARTTDVVHRLSGDDDPELANLVTVALALLAAATFRQESRGAHNRIDFPETSPGFERRLVIA